MIYSVVRQRRRVRDCRGIARGRTWLGETMLSGRWMIGLILVGAAVGCDSGTRTSAKQNPTTAPTAAPTTQPDQTALAPTTEPSSQPAVSELLIDGRPYMFPTAKLRVSKVNHRYVPRLYPNFPKPPLHHAHTPTHSPPHI